MSPISLKKGIPYIQSLCLNRIYSDPNSFDRRCNDIKKLVKESDYSEREVRQQILRARVFSSDSFLGRENTREEQNKISFNQTYYPVLQNVKKFLAKVHIFLTPDDAHQAIFTNIPIIGFKNGRSLKNFLFGAVLPTVDAEGISRPCVGRKRSCEVCKLVNDTFLLKRRDTNKTVNKDPPDCNSKHVIYSFECNQNQYPFTYVGSTKTKFKCRRNNYKLTHRNFRKKYIEKDLTIVIQKRELKQKLFHEHYCSEGHHRNENWSVTIIEQFEDLDLHRKKELYWINRLNT